VTVTGRTEVVIRARGEGVTEEPPIMKLWVQGERVSRWVVDSDEFSEYAWYGLANLSPTTVDVLFVNDNVAGGVDTSLIVDWMRCQGSTVKSESAQINWGESSFGGDGSAFTGGYDPGTELLDQNGTLHFVGLTGISTERELTYDALDRLRTITANGSTVSYTYDYTGERTIIEQPDGMVIRKSFFGYEEIDYSAEDTETVSHYFVNGQRVAQRSSVSALLYYHADHIGSAVRLTDEDGRIAHSYVYDPYGAIVYSHSATYSQTDLTIEGPTSVSGTYRGDETVVTTGSVTVNSGDDAQFSAGVSITLNPGFAVPIGATFTATIAAVGEWEDSPPASRYLYTDQEFDTETDWY
jgi:hypothetical protein